MSSRDSIRRFGDILQNIERIERYLAGFDEAAFEADELAQDGVKYCLLRMAEAATKLGPEAERQIPDQNWRRLRDLGNILRHEYDKVRLPTLWAIVCEDVPSLKRAVLDAGYRP